MVRRLACVLLAVPLLGGLWVRGRTASVARPRPRPHVDETAPEVGVLPHSTAAAQGPGPLVRERAVDRLEDTDAEILAIHALAGHPAGEVRPWLLARLLREKRESVVTALMWTLGRIGDASVVPALEAQMSAGNPSRSMNAALAIASVRDAARGGAIRRCDEILRSPDLRDADPIFFAAATLRGESIETVLAEIERSDYPEPVRLLARERLLEWRANLARGDADGEPPATRPKEGGRR